MQKHNWKFTYKAADLVAGAEAKKKAAEAKLVWWTAKKDELMKEVPKGIQVQESVSATYSNVKAGYGPQVVIDSNLQRKLSETHGRLIELNQTVKEYDGWIQVLTANATQPVELDHQDWLFFFGSEIHQQYEITVEEIE